MMDSKWVAQKGLMRIAGRVIVMKGDHSLLTSISNNIRRALNLAILYQ